MTEAFKFNQTHGKTLIHSVDLIGGTGSITGYAILCIIADDFLKTDTEGHSCCATERQIDRYHITVGGEIYYVKPTTCVDRSCDLSIILHDECVRV